jgi:hypothetical protein
MPEERRAVRRRLLLAACTGILLVQAAPLAALAAQVAEAVAATSGDGRWRARAEGHAVVIEDALTLERARVLRAAPLGSSATSAVAAIHANAPRRSFIVTFDTLLELWEISLDPKAEPIYDGFVHDYKMGEGIAIPGFLNPRRTKLEAALRGLAFDRSGAFVLGRAPDLVDGRAVLQVWQLDVRRRIGQFIVTGNPDTAAATPMQRDGRDAARVPDLAGGPPLIINWRQP